MIVFIFQVIATVYVAMVASSLILHGFGSCWLFVAFLDDLKAELFALNAYRRKKISDTKLYKQLRETIQFHSEIKQLS